jgi:hypothetical protein
MPIGAIHIIFTILLINVMLISRAQQSGIYIPKHGKVFLASDSAGFFSNVINQGNLGIAKNAVVKFSGKAWKNDPGATLTNETGSENGNSASGGKVQFEAQNGRQQLDGGYNAATKTGPRFFDLSVENTDGVELTNSSTKVTHETVLNKGKIYLGDNIFVAGHNAPGIISNYNENRYFVTANKPGSGLLIREGIGTASGLVTFPVGTQNGYTPAALRTRAARADDFFVSVFDKVRTAATSGPELTDETVGTTWEAGRLHHVGTGEVDLVLQHNQASEGSLFSPISESAFISMYKNNRWDTAAPKNAAAGYLTTGPAVATAKTNIRTFLNSIGSSTYFTKFVQPQGALKTKITLYGFRINEAFTSINWGTQPEVNIESFVVQRRWSTEANFKNVDTVASIALSRISTRHLYYTIKDPNSYSGVSFYRIMLRAHNGEISYSETIAVGARNGEFNMMLWPNPTPDECYVSINTALPVKSVVVWDGLGQVLHEEPVNGRRVVRLSLRPYTQALYIIGITSPSGKLLATEKIIRVYR